MGFGGNLASMSLADIFQNLAANGQTGTLAVHLAVGDRWVRFENGLVTDAARAHSGHGLKPLAGYLAGRCLISDDQAEYALRRIAESGGNLMKVLPELGYASEEEVKRLVIGYVEEEVYDLFTWESGEFEFADGDPAEGIFGPESATAGVRLPTGGLVMEAARRIDEWGRIRKTLPSGKEVLLASPEAEGRSESLDAVSKRVLGLADGTRDIDDLVADSYLSRFEVGGVLCSFLEQGLLRTAQAADLEGAAAELVKRRRPERAVKVYERLIALGQDSMEMRNRLADTAVQAGDPGRAVIHLGVIADRELESGKADRAAEVWERILELMPGNTRALQGLAEHCRRKNQKKPSLKYYAELTRAHLGSGAAERAVASARAGLEVDVRSFEMRSLLAEALLESGKRSEAAEEYERLGDQLLEDHRTRAAADAYRKALQIEQSRRHARSQLGLILADEAARKRAAGRRLVVLVITLIVLCIGGLLAAYEYLWAMPGFLQAEKVYNERKRRAEKLFAERDYEGAIAAYREAIKACGPVERVPLSFHGFENKAASWRGLCEQRIKAIESELFTDTEAKKKRSRELRGQATLLITECKLEDARAKLVELTKEGVVEDREWATGKIQEVDRSLERIRGVLKQLPFSDEDREYREVMALVSEFPLYAGIRKLTVPVRVESDPPGAEVTLPEGPKTLTPCSVRLPVTGAVQLGFTRLGYKDETLSVEAAGVGAARTIKVTLDRVPAWKVRIGVPVEAPITLSGDMLVFGDRGGNVWALGAKDGKQIWKRELGRLSAVTGGVMVQKGTAFVPSLDRNLYALDLATGKERWKAATGGLLRAAPAVARVPMLNNQFFIFIGSDDGRVYCIDTEAGVVRWRSEQIGAAQGSVLIGATQESALPGVRQAIYVGTDDDHLHALNPTDGKELWKLRIGAAVRTSPALSADGKQLYLGADDGEVYAVDLQNRRVDWRRKVAGSVCSGPVLNGERLFFGSSDGTMHCVRPKQRTAEPVWESRLGGRISASPLVTGSRVYIGTHDGRFFALDRGGDGAPVWSYRTGGWVRSTANWVDGLVIFGSDDGFLYAFDERQRP